MPSLARLALRHEQEAGRVQRLSPVGCCKRVARGIARRVGAGAAR